MFISYSIRNFPKELKKKLALMAIKADTYLSTYIIKILWKHVKEKEGE